MVTAFSLQQITTTSGLSQTTLAKNSLGFTLTVTAAPLELFCTLFCYNSTQPSDSMILNATSNVNTPLVQYWYGQFTYNSTSVQIIFNGLARNQQYILRCIGRTLQISVSNRTQIDFTVNNLTSVNFTTSATLQTQCAQFSFNTTMNNITQTQKQNLVNWCQWKYGSGNYVYDNGCVICVDSDMQIMNPGLAFSNNTSCVVTPSKSRLRFLERPSTHEFRQLQTPVYNSGVQYFTVCAVPDLVCASDHSTYSSVMTSGIIGTLNVKANLNSNLGSPVGTALLGLNVVTDSVTPDVTKWNSYNFTNTATGQFSVVTNYQGGSAIRCSFMASAVQPTWTALRSCNDTGICVNATVSAANVTVVNPAANQRSWQLGTTFNLWAVCYNDVAFPQMVTNVVSLGSFNYPVPTPAPSPNTTCPNSTNVYPNCSSSFLNLGLMGLLLLLGLLFN